MLVIGEVSTSSIQTGTPASPGRRREPLLARVVRAVLGTLPRRGCLPVAPKGCSPCRHRRPARANHLFAGACHRQALLVAGLVSLSRIARGEQLFIRFSDKKAEIDILAAEYISTVKTLSSDQRVEHLQKIQSAYNKCKEYSDDKVQLAMQTYEMVSGRPGPRGGEPGSGRPRRRGAGERGRPRPAWRGELVSGAAPRAGEGCPGRQGRQRPGWGGAVRLAKVRRGGVLPLGALAQPRVLCPSACSLTCVYIHLLFVFISFP